MNHLGAAVGTGTSSADHVFLRIACAFKSKGFVLVRLGQFLSTNSALDKESHCGISSVRMYHAWVILVRTCVLEAA